jgi:hypothetical protein
LDLKWTPESISQWQEFYNDAPRFLFAGRAGNFTYEYLPRLPAFEDFKPPECKGGIPTNSTILPTSSTVLPTSSTIRQKSFVLFTLISFLTTVITNVFLK